VRTLTLTLTLTLGLSVAPAYADPVQHAHTSSRYDRTSASLAHLAHQLRARHPDLLTVTEVDNPRRARALRARGWAVYRPPGTDVAISWPRARWRLAGARSQGLGMGTGAGWVVLDPRHPRSAGTQHSGRILVTLAHLPAHVQDGDSWRAGEHQVTRWRHAVRRWAHQLEVVTARRDPDLVLVVADWNVDLRRAHWRAVVRSYFPGLSITWRRPLPAAGTHAGHRLIDATLTDGRGRARLLPRTASSDHRPYTERVTAARSRSATR
jgi:hypothetical protein